ncbi:putative short-chain dehydrogenase/reductase [Astrocystis sublimbata]|nr:putative short-chain dehydrogenase/reductase [Astrocystis sublimbata]
MSTTVSKKTALITGCSDGGIGAAMAKILREEDYHVFATMRNKSKAGTLASFSHVEILELDVTSDVSIQQCASHVQARTGGTLDILINNAGRDHLMPLLNADIKEAKRFFDANFWGALAVTQAFASMVIKAKGTIVNHSSVAWNLPTAWGGIYSSSKAALRQLSNVLRVELEPLGVRVVTAMIGSAETNIFTNSHPDHLQMPSNSYYEPIRQFLVDARRGKMQPNETPVDVIARQLVNDVLHGRESFLWRGVSSTSCKWLSSWLPGGMLDSLCNRTRGVQELRQYYAKSS